MFLHLWLLTILCIFLLRCRALPPMKLDSTYLKVPSSSERKTDGKEAFGWDGNGDPGAGKQEKVVQRDSIDFVVEKKYSEYSLSSAYGPEDGRDTDEAEEQVGHGEGRQSDNGRSLEWLKLDAASSACDPLITTSSASQHCQTDRVADRTEQQHARYGHVVDKTTEITKVLRRSQSSS